MGREGPNAAIDNGYYHLVASRCNIPGLRSLDIGAGCSVKPFHGLASIIEIPLAVKINVIGKRSQKPIDIVGFSIFHAWVLFQLRYRL